MGGSRVTTSDSSAIFNSPPALPPDAAGLAASAGFAAAAGAVVAAGAAAEAGLAASAGFAASAGLAGAWVAAGVDCCWQAANSGEIMATAPAWVRKERRASSLGISTSLEYPSLHAPPASQP